VNHVFHAALLVSTSVCPPMAISLLAPATVLPPGQLDATLSAHAQLPEGAQGAHASPLQDAQATHTQPLRMLKLHASPLQDSQTAHTQSLQPAQTTQTSQDHPAVNLDDVLAHPELFNSAP